MRAAIHITSAVSEGRHSLREIAETARDVGIDVVVITDRDLMRWEYGAWPLRSVIRKRVENNSVLRYGIDRYLSEIEELKTAFPDMVFIPGVESAPFYYWEGSPFTHSLKMFDWHKHILTIGLETSEAYDHLPVVGNTTGLRNKFNPLKLWPILTLTIGLLCLRKRKYSYADHTGKGLGPYSRKWQVLGGLVGFLSLLFLINNWPFCSYAFDQYHGNPGSAPYQNYIDYVRRKGGLTFWAHPEAENVSEIGDIAFETKDHCNELLRTNRYTGYAVFYEGYRKVGKPGGLWDTILMEYCRGLRADPVWAICGMAFEGSDDLSARMRSMQTIVLVQDKSKRSVLDALGKGRAYAIRKAETADFILDRFCLTDESGGVTGIVGETVRIPGKSILHIEGHSEENQQEVEAKIIRGGETVRTYTVETPFQITHSDDTIPGEKSYYRLEIRGKGLHLVTNPIFVTRSKAAVRP